MAGQTETTPCAGLAGAEGRDRGLRGDQADVCANRSSLAGGCHTRCDLPAAG